MYVQNMGLHWVEGDEWYSSIAAVRSVALDINNNNMPQQPVRLNHYLLLSLLNDDCSYAHLWDTFVTESFGSIEELYD